MKHNIRRLISYLILFTSLAISIGCVGLLTGRYSNSSFDTSYVSNIEKGVTTKDDIRKNIGEPKSTMISNGEVSWTYHNITAFNSGKTKYLMIMFKGDTVSHYTYTEQ